MRIRRYVAAECVVLVLALTTLGLLARGAVHWLSSDRHRQAPAAMAGRESKAMAGLAPRIDETNPALFLGASTTFESAGFFLGREDDPLIARLRDQPIVRMKPNKGGSSLSFRVDLADGSRAAFKPAQTNLQTMPRKEVAAYRLNRLLGLGAVAPATPRMVSRNDVFSHLVGDGTVVARVRTETIFDPRGTTAGVMMFWIPVIKDSGLDTPEGIAESNRWLTLHQPIPPSKHALAAQLSDMLVFDFLISNPDRYSGGNMLTNEDGTRLYFMDNTMSFFIEPEGSEKTRTALHRAQRFSRRLFQALDRISEAALSRVLAQASEGDYEILTTAEITAVVARRDYVKRYIQSLIAKAGADEVLYFQ